MGMSASLESSGNTIEEANTGQVITTLGVIEVLEVKHFRSGAFEITD